jgi:hypothetical protein
MNEAPLVVAWLGDEEEAGHPPCVVGAFPCLYGLEAG